MSLRREAAHALTMLISAEPAVRVIAFHRSMPFGVPTGTTPATPRLSDVALIRLEQISPFPYHEMASQITRYPNASTFIWAQEEPMNMGELIMMN